MTRGGDDRPAQSTGSTPLVSVVIVSWNTADLLDRTLTTLYTETEGLAFEVIVVDNGSEDGSVARVRARHPGVIVEALPANIGFGSGANVGANLARGEYLLFLNSDTECQPSTVPGLTAEMKSSPRTGCAGARHFNPDGSLQRSTNAFPTLANDFLELTGLAAFGIIQRWLRPRFPWWGAHDTRIETGWVNGACMMIRRGAFDAVGGFDEAFFLYAEELDLCYRIQKAGWQIVFTPEAQVVHVEAGSRSANPTVQFRLRFLGHVRFYRKHYTPIRAAAFRVLVAVVALGRIVAIAGLGGLSVLGYSPSPVVYEAVVFERVHASYAAWIRAWFAVMLNWPVEPADLQPRLETRVAAR